MAEKREPEPKDKRPSDDLEVAEEVAEEVKGCQNVGSKFRARSPPTRSSS